MAEPDKKPVTIEELLVSSLATDALAKLLIERGLITREEFMRTGDVSSIAAGNTVVVATPEQKDIR